MTTDKHLGFPDMPMSRPCKYCIGCRLDKSIEWAIRCVHTARNYDDNCFITLTYDPDSLPENGVLIKEHWQTFMRDLRDRLDYPPLQFYMAGEYGDQNFRPHYHACLFGYRPDDLVFVKEEDGVKLYSSAFLMSIWKKGFVTVGDVTFESAAYCARYTMKKIYGKKFDDHYKNRLNLETGEIFDLEPEFSLMSRRPAIGRVHIEQHMYETYLRDTVIFDGREVRVPKYYDRVFESSHRLNGNGKISVWEKSHDDFFMDLRQRRLIRGREKSVANTLYHRNARFVIATQKAKLLSRKL